MYLAEHPALALLETSVHHVIASIAAQPDSYRLLRVEADDGVAMAAVTSPCCQMAGEKYAVDPSSPWRVTRFRSIRVAEGTERDPVSSEQLGPQPLHLDAGRIRVTEV